MDDAASPGPEDSAARAAAGAAADAAPLATGPRGMQLLDFLRLPEDSAFTAPVFTRFPVTYVLVVLRDRRGRLLLVHERGRACWELPGGGIEPGESPREAAVRELREEAGHDIAAGALRFEGFARTRLPERRTLHGAVFTGDAEESAGFVPTEEIAAVHWWDGRSPVPAPGELQTVDACLAELVRG
ncbi:NUDIX hydrolase [Streptomyces sp. YIM 98790]|uniref:NUDIX hydrolase n=1 Tax=Streptomyces sp. YIM 98790 TaxID=2689077 RepID=UPI0014093611|nr:NUDIX domain-containing protein [Streptomyces sp. YIM 98790]